MAIIQSTEELGTLAFDVGAMEELGCDIDPNTVAGKINEILGGAYIHKSLDNKHNLNLPMPGTDRIEQARTYIRTFLEIRWAKPDYKAALDAYRRDAQDELKTLIPAVFGQGSLRTATDCKMYHGIKVTPDMTPETYVDLLEKILAEGIEPSPYGYHGGMDENIRPVYGTNEDGDIHGLLYVSMRPSDHGYCVFDDRPMEEYRVYTPNKMKVPMQAHFYATIVDNEDPVSESKHTNMRQFHIGLERVLDQRKIDHERF